VNRLGVLWSNSTGLYLSVYNITSSGALTPVKTIIIASPWSGANAAEAARVNPSTPGWLIAAGDKVYFVDGRSLTLSGYYPISGASSYTSYAALYSYDDWSGRDTLYVFANDTSQTYVFAVDLAGNKTVFVDTVATGTSQGYGDPSLVWVYNGLDIVRKGTPGARPYMFYTTSNGRITYYDLSRGGSMPFPIPEPWIVGLHPSR